MLKKIQTKLFFFLKATDIHTITFFAAQPIDNTSRKLSPCRMLSCILHGVVPPDVLAAMDYMYYTHPMHNDMLRRRTLIGAVETNVPQVMSTYCGIQCAFCGRVWHGDTATIATKSKYHCGIATVPEAALHMILELSKQRPIIETAEKCQPDTHASILPYKSPLETRFVQATDRFCGGTCGVVASIGPMAISVSANPDSMHPTKSVPLFLQMRSTGWEPTSNPNVFTKNNMSMYTYDLSHFNTPEKFLCNA